MEECEPVNLVPFVHQVGGTNYMFKYDSTTVCKPLVPREHLYYQTMPECLMEFTPEYRGVVDVVVEDIDGDISLIGYPSGLVPKRKNRSLSNLRGNSPGSSGECGNSESDGEDVIQPRKLDGRDNKGKPAFSHSLSFECLDHENEGKDKQVVHSQNPWSIRSHKKHIERLQKGCLATGSQKFILLENVVSHLQFPCILDLKMGTRQHGDDDSESKRQTKIQRCATTTSRTLGVRVCGMQVYQLNSGNYVCKNKYYGRRLTEQGFLESLTMFFHNGCKMRLDVIELIVEKLKQMHSLLSKQNTYRFYSSSLLIMYDGRDRRIENCRKPSSNNGKENSGVSNRKSSSANSPNSDESDRLHRPRSSDRKSDTSAHSSPERSRSRDHLRENKDDNNWGTKVDVRMIDFAHTTFQGFPSDKVTHTGPDTGYLFGLENLIKTFLEIKQAAMSSDL
ncbi:inositol hexakisphosphate kinase 1-like [Tubulanus polymorphus]|uniref:inositol hexakisphosphate kinase 1-like n=1 Tax=Tubulanus polymorphus TaxID=672921 RepID=UPI003DA41E48